jgi:polysaccharide biosynthesis/export protein
LTTILFHFICNSGTISSIDDTVLKISHFLQQIFRIYSSISAVAIVAAGLCLTGTGVTGSSDIPPVDGTIPAVSEPGQSLAGPYVIGPEDVIRITVLGQSEYKITEEKTVSKSGRILLSIMSEEFEIGGLTVSDAADRLEAVLAADYLRDPRVIIEITEYNSQKVLIIGEVRNPGELTLQSASLSLKDLLIQSGGPVGTMDKTVVVVSGDNSNDESLSVLSLDELLLSNTHDNLHVQSGDIIYVLGRDKNLPVPDIENTVYVFGQVGKPGIIPFTRNMTVLRAIINAGNFTSAASPARTSVKRQTGKKIETINVNLDRVMSGGDKSQDIDVQPGDVIYVPRAIF